MFIVGASIKEAGKRAFNIVPVEAPPMVEGMIGYAEQEWSNCTEGVLVAIAKQADFAA